MNKLFIIILFSFILFLNTSFQNNMNEMSRIESEYMVPGIMHGLNTSLSDSGTHNITDVNRESIALFPEVQQFYVLNGFKPAWTKYNHLNENGLKLIGLIENAREYGLEPGQYHLNTLREIQQKLADKKNHYDHDRLREVTEILLTDAALKLMVNLHCGYGSLDSTRFTSGWIENLPGYLVNGNTHDRLLENILGVQPGFVEYTRLRQATSEFVRQTELTEDWQDIPNPQKDSALFFNQVKQILINLGYVKRNCGEKGIRTGLKEFQLHHGLEPDGKPGKNTLEALGMNSLYHYKMLALNLDRLRKQDNSGENLLYVNIPAYRLKIFKENQLQQIYQVIVGSPKTPTPQLNSRIERIIANPVWDVPQSIVLNEILPKIKADSGYLKRNGFRLRDKQNRTIDYENIDMNGMADEDFDYKVRQDASSANALGKVKFIFSNPYAVYLHDTPGKTLFSNDMRALSHGCIRVQYSEKLAEYLVRELESDSTDICGLISNGTRREINLVTTIPIHISYITCDTDEKGGLFFYKDIYGIDQKELADLSPFMGI